MGESVQSMYNFCEVKLPKVAFRACCAGEDSSFAICTANEVSS